MKSKTKLLVILWLLLTTPAYEAHGQVSKTFNLDWTDNASNEEGFYVYRDNVNIATLPVNSTFYSNTVDGAAGQQFCYEVSAFNHEFTDGTGNLQESGRSNIACGVIPSGGPVFPDPPINLVAQCNMDGTQALLSWSVVQGATDYALRVNLLSNDNASCAYNWLCSTPPDFEVNSVSGTAYAVPVIPDSQYNWWVHALQDVNWGNPGSSIINCPGAPPPPGDTEPPTVTITNPINGAVVQRKATVNIQLTYSDNVGVVETRYFINSALLTNCGILTNSCNWSVPGAPHKTYLVGAEVRDAAGNLGAHQVTVTVP